MEAATTLEAAVEQLRREPGQPVRARVAGLTIEIRVACEPPANRSAADVFAEIGPWAGETTDEIMAILAAAREQGRFREPTRDT